MDLHTLGSVPFRWCSSHTLAGSGRKQDRVYAPISAKDGSLCIGRDSALTHVLTDGRVVNFDIPRVIQEVEDSEGGAGR